MGCELAELCRCVVGGCAVAADGEVEPVEVGERDDRACGLFVVDVHEAWRHPEALAGADGIAGDQQAATAEGDMAGCVSGRCDHLQARDRVARLEPVVDLRRPRP